MQNEAPESDSSNTAQVVRNLFSQLGNEVFSLISFHRFYDSLDFFFFETENLLFQFVGWPVSK